jgi:predicted lipoprotein
METMNVFAMVSSIFGVASIIVGFFLKVQSNIQQLEARLRAEFRGDMEKISVKMDAELRIINDKLEMIRELLYSHTLSCPMRNKPQPYISETARSKATLHSIRQGEDE